MSFAAVRRADVQKNPLILAIGIAPLGKGIDQPLSQSSPRLSPLTPLCPFAGPPPLPFTAPLIQQAQIFLKRFGQAPQPARIAPNNRLGYQARLAQTAVQVLAVDAQRRPQIFRAQPFIASDHLAHVRVIRRRLETVHGKTQRAFAVAKTVQRQLFSRQTQRIRFDPDHIGRLFDRIARPRFIHRLLRA